MPKALLCLFLVVAFAQATVTTAQQKVVKHRLTGVIRDQSGEVVPGLSLSSDKEKGYGGISDINGEFVLELSPDDHVITAGELESEKFRAFVKIVESGPNPDLVEFVVDSSGLCKKSPDEYQYPAVTKSVRPPFPPGGAIRVSGTVYVMVKVGLGGKVMSAKAVSGHPLHRKVSENAALRFEFDSTSIKSEIELPLRFIFVDSLNPRKDVQHYSCDYRIIIDSEPVVIQASVTHS